MEIEFPQEFRNLAKAHFGQITEPSTYTLTSVVQSPNRPVRIDLACDDGDGIIFDYIDFLIVQAGDETVTLRNDNQPIPIRFTLTVPTGRYDFGLDDNPIPVHWLVKWETLKRCLAKPGRFDVTLVSTGQPLSGGSRPAIEHSDYDEGRLRLYEDLERIGTILRNPIMINLDSWSEDDWKVSQILIRILSSPHLQLSPWREVAHPFLPSQAQEIQAQFANGQSGPIRLTDRDKAILCGQELDLGTVEIIHSSVRLADSAMPHIRINTDGDEVYELRFVALQDNVSTMKFLDWPSGSQPTNPSEIG
jgi:hypothetical protein